MEVLEHAPTSARRSLPRWVWFAIAGVTVVLLLGWWLDGMQRDRESTSLQQAHASALSTVERAESAVLGTVSYASPQLQVGPPEVRAALEELVLEEVADGIAAVDAARQALLEQTVLPWHAEQQDLRVTLLADLDDRSVGLREATGQGLGRRG